MDPHRDTRAARSSGELSDIDVFFLALLMLPLGYRLYAWPVVAVLAAGITALRPARRARRRARLVAALSAAIFPLALFGLLAILD